MTTVCLLEIINIMDNENSLENDTDCELLIINSKCLKINFKLFISFIPYVFLSLKKMFYNRK